jgi:hypothetical protein
MGRFYFCGLRNNLFLPKSGVYECLLGISKSKGDGLAGSPEATAAALMDVLQQVCVMREGPRDADLWSSASDQVDAELFLHLKACCDPLNVFQHFSRLFKMQFPFKVLHLSFHTSLLILISLF